MSRLHPTQRGQTLTLFLLIFVTLLLIGVVAVAMGQTLVRRQHAQMVVDAAAFAGASRQAQGMNNIASLNKTAQILMAMIQAGALLPHVDSEATSWEILALSVTVVGPAVFRLAEDWERDALEAYSGIFDLINYATTAVNVGYAAWPLIDADGVVDANFGSGKLFPGEVPAHNGRVFTADYGLDPTDYLKLVKLTDPGDYHVRAFGPYVPNPTVLAELAEIPIVGEILIADLVAATAESWLAAEARMLLDPVEYSFGQFYDNPSGRDVRFTYFLTIKETSIALGSSFFDKIPEITVVASAKPYDGYLGDDFTDWGLTLEGSNEIREEYKARLAPVKPLSLAAFMPLRIGDSSDLVRWATITH